MLQSIHDEGDDGTRFIAAAKGGSKSNRLMGFGHAVYRNFDPRAKIIGEACGVVLKKLGKSDPLLDIAKNLEQAALKDDYFVSRKLYPNVDFYSASSCARWASRRTCSRRHVRDRPRAGLDRQLARGRLESQGPHLPPPPDLRRPGQARLRADGPTRLISVAGAALDAARGRPPGTPLEFIEARIISDG
jgi:hypothetical protein